MYNMYIVCIYTYFFFKKNTIKLHAKITKITSGFASVGDGLSPIREPWLSIEKVYLKELIDFKTTCNKFP